MTAPDWLAAIWADLAADRPGLALLALAALPVPILLGRRWLLAALLLEAGAAAALLGLGLEAGEAATWLVVANLALSAVVLRRTVVRLQGRLADREATIQALHVAEERRKAAMARTIPFPTRAAPAGRGDPGGGGDTMDRPIAARTDG